MKETELDRRGEPEKRRMVITTGSWVRGVVVVIVTIALFAVRDVMLAVLASIVIASAVDPAAVWAKRHGIPRLPALLAVYIIMATIFAGLFYFLFLPLLGELSGFIQAFPDYSSSLAAGSIFTKAFGASGVPSSFSPADVLTHVNAFVASFSQGVFSSATFIFGGVFSFMVIIVLSFYLAVQEDGIGKFLKVITPWRQEAYVVDLWRRSKDKIGRWMQGQILLAVIIAVLAYLGLLLVGVPHPLLLAASAGCFEIIPLFGPILAAIPAILVGFSSGGMPEALIVAGLFLIIQQFENQLIYPLVVKKVIGVPPMVSIIALLVGFELAGFLGILISVPMATILMEFISDLSQEKSDRVSHMKTPASL